MPQRKTLLWLQAGSCGGCTMSVLEEGARGWFADLKSAGIDLLWHPSVSVETGAEVIEILAAIERGEQRLDIFASRGRSSWGRTAPGASIVSPAQIAR